jgi:hypothetical protein
MTRSQSSGLSSPTAWNKPIPALFTKMSNPPQLIVDELKQLGHFSALRNVRGFARRFLPGAPCFSAAARLLLTGLHRVRRPQRSRQHSTAPLQPRIGRFASSYFAVSVNDLTKLTRKRDF